MTVDPNVSDQIATSSRTSGAQPVPPSAPVQLRAPGRWDRRMWLLVTLAGLAWSVARAGYDPSALVHSGGWGEVSDFLSAAVAPDLSGELLRLAGREAAVTVSYALLGTVLSLVIGLAGGMVLAERTWAPLARQSGSRRRQGRWRWWGWRLARAGFAVPRSMHEVVFGLVLVSVLGLDPLVAVLAIGIPFGAVTAKVFSEVLDEAPRDAERALRAAGAGRVPAMVFGVFPSAMGDLLSYAFYRFECAIRSAAVLGIVGAGGLGVQIRLSFDSLRYDEVWTMLWMLVAISGLADLWSSAVRRRRRGVVLVTEMRADGGSRDRGVPPRDGLLRASAVACAVAAPVAWWWLGVDVRTLWSDRSRQLAGELARDAWPPQAGDGGLGGVISDAADTVALAVLASAMAWTIASVVAFVAARTSPLRASPEPRVRTRWLPISTRSSRVSTRSWSTWVYACLGAGCRFLLLVARSVPPPVWAFLAVLLFLPGIWPGAIALGLYNLGVLGRLQGEVVENLDDRPSQALRAEGAGRVGVLAYATVPAVSARFVALGLYRWEVAVRETVMVGVAGAAGLGRRLDEQMSSFHYSGILATLLALLAVTVAVDLASAAVRRTLR